MTHVRRRKHSALVFPFKLGLVDHPCRFSAPVRLWHAASQPFIHLHDFKGSSNKIRIFYNLSITITRRSLYFKPCLLSVVAAVQSSRELSIAGWELTKDRQLLPRRTPLSLLPPHQILNTDHSVFQRRRRKITQLHLADQSRGQVTLDTNCLRHPI